MRSAGGARLTAVGEDAVVRLFRTRPGRGVLLGPGDDAALVRPPPGSRLLLTADLLAEDVHFRRSWAAPEDLGYKLAAVNVSDIAAMGGRPLWALLSLALPPDLEAAFVTRLRRGLLRAARRFGFAIAGGDTCASGSGIVLSLALVGAAGRHALTRAGARPGELIHVTGHLGASTLGLAALERHAGAQLPRPLRAAARRHLRPEPPLAFAAALARRPLATAAMDVSDGVSRDLARLCAESGAGAEIDLRLLPVRPGTGAAARLLGRDPLAAALHGGEEYELLFTADPADAGRIAALARRRGVRVTVIGRIQPARRRLTLLDANGKRVPLTPRGWEHFGRS
jgi:thiamine-monophosphate kinase